MATVSQKLGTKIKETRKKRGISQEKLAEAASMDYSYLNLIESGKRNPSIKRITKLARVLKISLKDLFSFDK